MKYIRTKDNAVHRVIESYDLVYEVIDESVKFLYVYTNPSDGTEVYSECGYCRDEIVKESDDVKELFDELVCDKKPIARSSNVKETIARLLHEGKTIYGAIWTDNGLIYVAECKGKEDWRLR